MAPSPTGPPPATAPARCQPPRPRPVHAHQPCRGGRRAAGLGRQAFPGRAKAITSTPADPTSSTSAAFGFTGPGGATFQCQFDGTAFAACTSPGATPGRWRRAPFLLGHVSLRVGRQLGDDQLQLGRSTAARAGHVNLGKPSIVSNSTSAAFYQHKFEKALPTSGAPSQITGSVSG